MVEQLVPRYSMSVLFSQDRDLERLPEPFRLQGNNVMFSIDYSEYVRYIQTLDETKYVKLMTDMQRLRELAVNNNSKLYNCYLADCAFAICKEVAFSEEYNKPATVILPVAYGVKGLPLQQFASLYDGSLVGERDLLDAVARGGFRLSTTHSDRNLLLLKTAVVLNHWSRVRKSTSPNISITYDTLI